MTAIAGLRARWIHVCALVTAEESAVFPDSFALLYFAITCRMGTVLICHPYSPPLLKRSGTAILFRRAHPDLGLEYAGIMSRSLLPNWLTLSAEIKAFTVELEKSAENQKGHEVTLRCPE
jgi:hypothetical protein